MKKWLFTFLWSIFLPFAAWGEGLEKRVPQGVTLVFSANVYGEIEPCG